MTFAAPLFAWLAGAVALATVALHLLAWRRPPESPLPTARFAPERPIRMVSRAVRPADLALLALRVALVLLVGAALAGPIVPPRRQGAVRVVMVDRSRSAGNGVDAADRARGVFRASDALVVFDSAAREVVSPTPDSIGAMTASDAPGSLSAALIVATRVARRLARDHDSVTIAIVSPFAADELDAATASIRRTWPGAVELVRAGAPPNDSFAPGRPDIRATSGDPVAVSLALGGALAGGQRVRVTRDGMTAADSAWVRAGNAFVLWPAEAPGGWQRPTRVDTAFAVSTVGTDPGSGATVVAAFERVLVPPSGRIVGRWSDGQAAVTEAALGSGCVRSVGVPVPATGDLALTPAFRRFAQRMAAPCGTRTPSVVASDSTLATILPARLSSGEAVARASVGGTRPRSTLAAWLLGLALAAAVVEMFLRRGDSHAAA